MVVAVGERHIITVGSDGSVFCFGDGNQGQLGTGNTTNSSTPTRVAGLPPWAGPVRQVAAGEQHTGIVTDAGGLFMCGSGARGQLGLGDEEARATPTLVPRAVLGDEAVLMVACGRYHTVVATEGGAVYTFGLGWDGRLGHGDEQNQVQPRRVAAAAFRPNGVAEGDGERVVMVAAGLGHSAALSEAGHVFTWGLGFYGQCGVGDEEKELTPRHVEEGLSEPGEKVVFVAAAGSHTAAVTAGGRLYTWGDGLYGKLGHGDTLNRLVPTLVGGFGALEGGRVVMVACGDEHTLVVTHDGALWACGRGNHGQLGLNDAQNRDVFERVGAMDEAQVVAAAAGQEYSVAVTEDGALWTWGRGDDGRLGHGDEEDHRMPTPVPREHFGGLRVGRCRVLPRAHALAFLMGTKRQSQGTVTVKTLAGEMSLFPMIRSWCATVLPGLAGRMEGVMRLCGGFDAWRHQRAVVGR